MRRVLAILLTLAAILGAAWLVLRRPDVPFETLEAAYARAESQFIALGEGEFVHYTDTGPRDAPVVLLLHGFSASLATWDSWRAELEKRWRVITVDLPGHGLTRTRSAQATMAAYADFLDRFADRIGLDSFALVGSSMGGNIAWHYTLAHPARVRGLVLVDASGWPQDPDTKRPLVFRLLANPLARALLKDLDQTMLVRAGLKSSFQDDSLVTDAMVERYTMLARAPGHRDMLLQLSANSADRQTATPEILAAITAPTLVMHGALDELTPLTNAERFAAAIPGAELVVFDGVGHLPQEEIPARSLQPLQAFLETVFAPPASPLPATAEPTVQP